MSNIARYSHGRGPSQVFTGFDFERLEYGDGGFLFWDEFRDLLTGRYVSTQATAGTFALDDLKGGVAILDSNSTTTTQGIQIQKKEGSTGEMFAPDADDTLAFECRIAFHDLGALATAGELFIGLASIDTSIIASSATSATTYLGFESVTDDGVILGVSYDGTTRKTATSIYTIIDSDVTADSWVKLGFRVDGTNKVTFYVNGVAAANGITASIPTALMTPSAVCQTSGTTDVLYKLDWWLFAQMTGVDQ